MQNCESLAWYGALVLIVTGGFILVPYWRGKGELISAWNILLLGIAIFLGLGSFEAAMTPMSFPGLQWFEPSKAEVSRFLVAGSVFLAALFGFYYYDPLSRSAAARCLNKWPPITTPMLLYVLIVCSIVVLTAPFVRGVTFIGPTMLKLSHKAIVFICLFSFVLWFRQKYNFVWLAVCIAGFLYACLLAIMASGGRRLLLSVVSGPALLMYFMYVRNLRPAKATMFVAVATLAVFTVGLMYSSFRHFHTHGLKGERLERTASAVIERVQQLPGRNWFESFASNKLFYLSQRAAQYSLITDRFISTGRLEPQPLNAVKVIVSYIIPRNIWQEKPRTLATNIVHEAVGRRASNWGCGIPGHAAYEGGPLVTILYAYLAVLGVRMIDDPMRRQPTNPFLIAILATASTHIAAWSRGDIALMSIETAQCFLFAILLSVSARFLFGTVRAAQPFSTGMARARFAVR